MNGLVIRYSLYLIGRLLSFGGISAGQGFSIGYKIEEAVHGFRPFSVVGDDVKWLSGGLYPDGSGYPFSGKETRIGVGGSFEGPEYLANRVDRVNIAECREQVQSYIHNLSSEYLNFRLNTQSFRFIEPIVRSKYSPPLFL